VLATDRAWLPKRSCQEAVPQNRPPAPQEASPRALPAHHVLHADADLAITVEGPVEAHDVWGVTLVQHLQLSDDLVPDGWLDLQVDQLQWGGETRRLRGARKWGGEEGAYGPCTQRCSQQHSRQPGHPTPHSLVCPRERKPPTHAVLRPRKHMASPLTTVQRRNSHTSMGEHRCMACSIHITSENITQHGKDQAPAQATV
jgi:hypothetical protein